jgi:hypothetical protein
VGPFDASKVSSEDLAIRELVQDSAPSDFCVHSGQQEITVPLLQILRQLLDDVSLALQGNGRGQ